MKDLKVLGTISRSHGLKGAFKVNVYAKGVPELEEGEPVFIRLQGGPVPFFVEECSVNSPDKMVLKVEDVNTLEAADTLVGSEMLLEASRFDDSAPDTSEELLGFTVNDAEKGNIGTVSGFMDSPQHPILEVAFEDKTILIPWVEEIIKEVEVEKKVISIEAPDGLIDLYING